MVLCQEREREEKLGEWGIGEGIARKQLNPGKEKLK